MIAVASGIAGTLVLIILSVLLLCLRRRRRSKRQNKERPLDLTNEDPLARPPPSVQRSEAPFHFQPEPSAVISANTRTRSHDVRVLGAPSSLPSISTRSATLQSGVYAGARRNTGPHDGIEQKGDAPRIGRGMILVQHEDAGPSIRGSTRGLEMVEIPPAYTELRLAAVAARRSAFSPTPPRVPDRW